MNLLRSIRLHHLNLVSLAIVALGVISLGWGIVTTDGELWQLAGVMLILAGLIKVAVIHLWVRLAGLGTDRHDPVPPT